MPESYQGADLQALQQRASVNLAPLVRLLAQAIPLAAAENLADPKTRPLFLYDKNQKQLRICTSGVLLRLFSLPQFRTTFSPRSGNGFVQDFTPPGYGSSSRIGGQMSPSSDRALSTAVDKLRNTIQQELNRALPTGVALEDFVLENASRELSKLAKQIGTNFNVGIGQSQIFPLTFAESNSSKQDSKKQVAKIISAVERVDTGSYFERMWDAIAPELESEYDLDEAEIEDALASLKAEYDRSESQIKRFLNFLDDEALSRVRLNITCQIMEAIAQKAAKNSQRERQLLAEYYQRVNYFIEIAKNEGLTINLTSTYGQKAEINFLDYIHKDKFFSCLPVWPEWKTQIFEARNKASETTDYEVVREISYRFRVNGKNPELGKPAFEVRLEWIKEALLPQDDELSASPYLIRKHLAELIFLAVVIPSNETKLTKNDIRINLQKLLQRLEAKPKHLIAILLEKLHQRARSIDSIATALIAILRTTGDTIISQVQQKTSQQYICVKKGIVDWEKLQGAESGTKDLLDSGAGQTNEKIAWLRQIEVDANPTLTPNLLFSIKVTTELSERDLVIKDEAETIKLQRCVSEQILQILFVPYKISRDDNNKLSYDSCLTPRKISDWTLPKAIQVEYETRTLQLRETKNDREKQLHTAAVTSFAVLVYTCLWYIVRQIQQSNHTKTAPFTTSILRLQERREEDKNSGEAYIYAATQAIESMLAQDNPTRMQGMILANLQSSNARWIKRGVFNALASVFPIQIESDRPPVVPKIGLVSYIARPCDESPHHTQKNHLLIGQSYIATATETPFKGYEIKTERMQSDITYSAQELQKQRLIQEEVAHLAQQGCQHIILLSHAYGSRRVNKTVDYNTPLVNREFLQQLYQAFPNLTLYTLLRDVFPGTRLHQRKSGEAGFEISRASDHTHFLSSLVEKMGLRDIIPIYTFATLHAIEPHKRPQSGFCVYFLLSDRRIGSLDWQERSRQHLINPEHNSAVHPCLITLLRGLHFLESEQGIRNSQYLPVLDPFGWISPNTVEAAGEAQILPARRTGKVLLSYPAILTHIAGVLRRKTRI
ncbi:MAG: hypothetical protein SAJ12_00485 [Jaaginema sp. PMC 1079.18]|nr:hypothetical protein [Jaaginema sp. PMC 1080.18]MEC4849460.1 hypothetical protein [Jaaginema sp. PMC 1079.18]MEC4865441.1 hypothetical protein [Jaaginema sp. PMC 1078.18]